MSRDNEDEHPSQSASNRMS